jgi:tungstate transport system ATP-binding protein
VQEALETVGLAHKRHQQALERSSGEAKRLGIARAMVIDPQIFLLDEPTANLDPANTAIIEEVVLKLRAGGRSTILLITHDPAQARRLGDQMLVMQDGALVPA